MNRRNLLKTILAAIAAPVATLRSKSAHAAKWHPVIALYQYSDKTNAYALLVGSPTDDQLWSISAGMSSAKRRIVAPMLDKLYANRVIENGGILSIDPEVLRGDLTGHAELQVWTGPFFTDANLDTAAWRCYLHS